MKVEGTELEYLACDEVCLDYFLGEGHETKDMWAKRVWDNCKLYKENGGKDLDGNDLPKVYARDAEDLWEEKKRRRRVAFVRQCAGEDLSREDTVLLLDKNGIKEDAKLKKECKWPKSHDTATILMMKTDPKYKYRTATEDHIKKEAKIKKAMEDLEKDRKSKVSKLKKKFDDETIAILYPQGTALL